MMNQSLPLAERLFGPLLNCEKRATIRWRESTIEPGLMEYYSEVTPESRVAVWVTGCDTMALSEVAAFLGKQDDWPDDVMLSGMREHYPEIQLHDRVQVVSHLTPQESEAHLKAK